MKPGSKHFRQFRDVFGTSFRDADQIRFVFEYPDGPFRNTYRWNPEKGTWQWLMEQKDKNGVWAQFADLRLSKVRK